MNHRFLRRMIFALVAAQWLCAPPMASAFAALASTAGSHCGEAMSALAIPASTTPATAVPATQTAAMDDCACCAGHDMSTASCLSACTATVGAPPSFHLPVGPAAAMTAWSEPVLRAALLSDPPIKPPPIR